MSNSTTSSIVTPSKKFNMSDSLVKPFKAYTSKHPVVARVSFTVLYSIVALVLVLYANLVFPKLSSMSKSLLNNVVFIVFFSLLCVFLSIHDWQTAFVIAILFLMLFLVLKYGKTDDEQDMPSTSNSEPSPLSTMTNYLNSLQTSLMGEGETIKHSTPTMAVPDNANKSNLLPEQSVPTCVYASTKPSQNNNSYNTTGEESNSKSGGGSVSGYSHDDEYSSY
jgi:hypothetical protein